MGKTSVKATTRSDGTVVRAHERRVAPRSEQVSPSDQQVAADAAAAAAATHAVPRYGRFSTDGLSDEEVSGLARCCGNDDYQDMLANLTRGSEYGLGGRKIYSDWKDEHTPVSEDEIDHLGYRINNGYGDTSDGALALTRAVSSVDAPPDHLEAACVIATDLIIQADLDGTSMVSENDGPIRPTADTAQHRHTLMTIAAHPNAPSRAARQAILVEGKYSAKEVLARSRDSELLGFALDNADVGIWCATNEAGEFNPALPAEHLDAAVDFIREDKDRADRAGKPYPDDDDPRNPFYARNQITSLAKHPNITDEQHQRLTEIVGPRHTKR